MVVPCAFLPLLCFLWSFPPPPCCSLPHLPSLCLSTVSPDHHLEVMAMPQKIVLTDQVESKSTKNIKEGGGGREVPKDWESRPTPPTVPTTALTAKALTALDAAVQMTKQTDWLNDAEKRAYSKWNPCALPETCMAEITKHQAFTEEVQSHRAPIDVFKVKADDLKSQGSSDGGRRVERWMNDWIGRWEDLNGALEERQVQLYQAKDQADMFQGSYQSLVAGLGGVQEAQEKQKPIHSEVEVVKQQLEAHKEHLKVLANLESQLDDLDGLGQLLSGDCVKADGEIIQRRIAHLRECWDSAHSAAIARQSILEESLLSLGHFEKAYDKLCAWLTDVLRHLAEMKPITGDQDAIAAQLSEHKAFQKQHKTGDDCVKKKLQDLERKWEEVCQMSVERQDRLKQAYKLIGQFQSHLTPLRSWMTEVLPMLDDSEPVHGDVDTTDAFMTAHSSFLRELGSYQKSVDAANASGDHLVNEILDDPSVTKQELEEINEMWDTICQKSTQKQERLDTAYQAAREFEEAYNNMMLWMEDKYTELQTMSPPDEDASVLQQQIEEHTAFIHEATAKQPEYDTLLTDGRNLLQLAHPKAVPVLQDKLQHLEWRWVNLHGQIEGKATKIREGGGGKKKLESRPTPTLDNRKFKVGSHEHFKKFCQKHLLHGYQELMKLICMYRGTFKLKRQDFWIESSFFDSNKMFEIFECNRKKFIKLV